MLLIIETSTPTGSLALWDSEAGMVIQEQRFTSDRAHNAAIFEPLSEILAGDELTLSGICVGTGPGSYSGVRVGIAVANGLGLAHAVPVIGLSSWLALPVEASDYCVVGDGRRASYFCARVREGSLVETPPMLDEAAFREAVQEAEEAGLALYTTDKSVPLELEGVRILAPDASQLARAASKLSTEDWESQARLPLEPMYLREAYITQPSRRSTTVQESGS